MAEWETAIAIVLSLCIWIIYRASVELEEQHWVLKAFAFYSSLVLGWAAINYILRLAVDNVASTNTLLSVEIFYYAFISLSLLCFGYLIIKTLWWLFSRSNPYEKSHSVEDLESDAAW